MIMGSNICLITKPHILAYKLNLKLAYEVLIGTYFYHALSRHSLKIFDRLNTHPS